MIRDLKFLQPNRNGYSNLGGDVHAGDWRTETDTRGPYGTQHF